jgi:hypothetical protein
MDLRKFINEQDTLRESNPIQTESDLTHHVHPFLDIEIVVHKRGFS